MTIWEEDIPVHVVALPPRIHSLISKNDEGDVAIFINEALSLEMKRACLEHELAHFRRGDLDYGAAGSVDRIERERHEAAV